MSFEPQDGPAYLRSVRESMEAMMRSNTERLLDGEYDQSRPVHEQRRMVRAKLRAHGTDVDLNDRDLMGDGDQSPIHLDEAGKQVYRDLFAAGGDIVAENNDLATRRDLNTPIHKMFAFACTQGKDQLVKSHLEWANSEMKARKGAVDPALRFLLESRVTSMRLTPLLILVALGKGMDKILPPEQLKILKEKQLKIARLLLLYGARPDSKDVCGKTVVHYGAGIMASPMTMEVVRMCSAAYPSSHLFGKEVVLQGLKSEELNGKRGIARGFVVQSGRRVVYLIDDERELSVKPENVALADGTIVDPPRSLCDLQDRLGGTALLEVFMSNRVHIGKFLLDELHADPSVADWDGYSPESMSMRPGCQSASGIGPMVMKAVMKRKKAEKKAELNVCAQCNANGTTDHPLKNCAKCSHVAYCSRGCQVAHWRAGHKQECKKLAEEKQRTIVLERPPESSYRHKAISNKTGKISDGTYRKPSNVAVDEIFYVKVQVGLPSHPLLLYDKTRQCEFNIMPNHRGYEEITQIILAEEATRGTKTYMAASFDSAGNLRVFPGQTAIRSW